MNVAAFAMQINESEGKNADADDILTITKKINGGTNGLDSRKAYLIKAKKALGIK